MSDTHDKLDTLREKNARLVAKVAATKSHLSEYAGSVRDLKRRLAHAVERLEAARCVGAEEKARAKARITDLTHREDALRRARRVSGDALFRAQLPHFAAARRSRPPLSDPPRDQQYVSASAAWRAGHRPSGSQHRRIAGLDWTFPAGHGALADRLEHRGWLPFADIAAVRQFVVGGTMLDIGANIGTTAITRVVLGDVQTVYGAEPHPDNYQCLVGNILDNGVEGSVQPHQVAIAGHTGTASLKVTSNMAGHSLLAEGKRPPSSRAVIEVPCFTLDAWVQRLGVPVSGLRFVKIDVQGMEGHVLLGAGGLLDCPHVVWQIEITPARVGATGVDPGGLYQLLGARFDYVYGLDPTYGGQLLPASRIAEVMAAAEQQGDRFTDVVLGHGPLRD